MVNDQGHLLRRVGGEGAGDFVLTSVTSDVF